MFKKIGSLFEISQIWPKSRMLFSRRKAVAPSPMGSLAQKLRRTSPYGRNITEDLHVLPPALKRHLRRQERLR